MAEHSQEEADQLRKNIQAKIVTLITKGLRQGTITQDRAKQIAEMVLNKLSVQMSYEELIEVIPKLDDHFVELSRIVIPLVTEYEKKLREEMESQIHEHLQAKNFDEVLNLTKQAIAREKKLR